MQTTKLGVHVNSGPRDGYGLVAAAGPACVVSLEAGAFDEIAPETIKIYRDKLVYGDAPGDIDRLTAQDAYLAAVEYWGPLLEVIYRPIHERYQNVYFQPVNETGGNDEKSLTNIIQFELGLIDYFTPRGIKLAVGSNAGDSPVWDLWVKYYPDLLTEAAAGGHIYNRHAYGGVPLGESPLLTPLTANTSRPFVEADYLTASGIDIPIIISEAGTRGGVSFPGVSVFMEDAAEYDRIAHDYPEIAGIALWTYGNWEQYTPNIQSASNRLADYLIQREPYVWQNAVPSPEPKHKAIVVKLPQDMTADEWNAAAAYSFDFRHTVTASHDDMWTVLEGGSLNSYVKFVFPERQQELVNAVSVEYGAIDITENIFGPVVPSGFSVRHWPCGENWAITQGWGERPEYYSQFGWSGGHEGIDFGVPMGEPFYSVDYGTVERSTNLRDNGGLSAYGWHVVIRHADGMRTLYAHLAPNPPVGVGATVEPGTIIGYSGNTGNSTGPHLHFSILDDDAALPTFPRYYVNPELYLGITVPEPEPQPPTGKIIDMLAYMRGDGRQYMVRHPDGSQERFRTESDGEFFYMVKNSLWEEWLIGNDYIFLTADISPAPATDGTERYYRVIPGAWCKRYMAVGETFYDAGHTVQFYRKSDCQPHFENSGQSSNNTTLIAHYDRYEFSTGAIVDDVIEVKGNTETHWFARGFGRVAWSSPWGRSEITPEDVSGQSIIARDIIPCM